MIWEKPLHKRSSISCKLILVLKYHKICSKTLRMQKCFIRLRDNIKNGSLGNTAQFWITYMDMVKMQHTVHTAVQENNFEMRLSCWEYFCPYFPRKIWNLLCLLVKISREYTLWFARDVGKTRPECSSAGQVPSKNSCGSKRRTDDKLWC